MNKFTCTIPNLLDNTFNFNNSYYNSLESDCYVSLRIIRTGISEIPLTLILMILNITSSSFRSSSPHIYVLFQPLDSAQTVHLPISDGNRFGYNSTVVTEVHLLEGEDERTRGRLIITVDRANISVFYDESMPVVMEMQCKCIQWSPSIPTP